MNALVVGLTIVFWVSAGLVAYVFVGYSVLIAVLAKAFGRPPKLAEPNEPKPSVSVVISAFNEERTLDRRLTEFEGLISESGLRGEVIVVSDGSTDRTMAIAREHERHGVVRAIEVWPNQGKAVALSTGCHAATHDVIVFADARQTWAPDALSKLISPLADPTIGAVSGELSIESSPGVMAGVGLYWRFEKWLRANEGRLHSTVGATGAISCVRRELFRPIPPGTILDDVCWPLQVAMQGKRVVHTNGALAFDRLPDKMHDEFRRKVRTQCGNFQLMVKTPEILLPWRNPIWFQFVSHKLGRLVAPWTLITLFGSGLLLAIVAPSLRWLYLAATLGQAGFYAMAIAGMLRRIENKFVSAASSFLVLNAAAGAAFWVWVTGHEAKSWRKASYRSTVPTAET